jgi:hypothetical protein
MVFYSRNDKDAEECMMFGRNCKKYAGHYKSLITITFIDFSSLC